MIPEVLMVVNIQKEWDGLQNSGNQSANKSHQIPEERKTN